MTDVDKSLLQERDALIRSDVIEEINWDPIVTAKDVSVVVHDGVVELEGVADSFGSRNAAEQAAWRVKGVRDVVTRIEVDPKMLGLPDDTEIAADLEQRLKKDFLIPKGCIAFTVADSVVTLTGIVNWHFQRAAAREEAQGTRGVRSVNNFITIDRDFATPVQIDRDIQKALERNAQIDAANISVAADGGRVTLSGTARSFAERQEAEDAAWRAKGITEVVNEIAVQPRYSPARIDGLTQNAGRR